MRLPLLGLHRDTVIIKRRCLKLPVLSFADSKLLTFAAYPNKNRQKLSTGNGTFHKIARTPLCNATRWVIIKIYTSISKFLYHPPHTYDKRAVKKNSDTAQSFCIVHSADYKTITPYYAPLIGMQHDKFSNFYQHFLAQNKTLTYLCTRKTPKGKCTVLILLRK